MASKVPGSSTTPEGLGDLSAAHERFPDSMDGVRSADRADLARVGEYVNAFKARVAQGEALTDEQMQFLQALLARVQALKVDAQNGDNNDIPYTSWVDYAEGVERDIRMALEGIGFSDAVRSLVLSEDLADARLYTAERLAAFVALAEVCSAEVSKRLAEFLVLVREFTNRAKTELEARRTSSATGMSESPTTTESSEGADAAEDTRS